MPPEGVFSRANVRRGCGFARTAGGVYFETGVAEGGVPVEQFLLDPPRPYRMRVARGVEFAKDPKSGVWHVFDHVGESHYPFPSDFIEEGRLHGFSRKVNSKLIEKFFPLLSADSRLVIVHPKAIVTNAHALFPFLPEERLKHRCARFVRTGQDDHAFEPDTPCTRHWYVSATANETALRPGGELVPERRLTPDTSYAVEPLALDAPEPTFASGIIALLPITNVSVIKAPQDDHLKTLEQVRRAFAASGLPVTERPF